MYNCKVWNKIILSVQVLFISTSELTVGNVMFNIQTERGVWRRHHNQLQPRFEDIILNDNVSSHSDLNSTPSPNHNNNNNNSNDQSSTSSSSVPSRKRYPLRVRKPPDFYQAS